MSTLFLDHTFLHVSSTQGKVLFKPGSMEESIYIVQSGQLNLYVVDKKGQQMLLKKVMAGENIHSVMNILDAIRVCT